ncbi:MAG: histidinol-phosphate transaminase [Nitrososphaerota archaeon]|jgi:histidinol-phosphate aminotransferase|uniref:histidinol-phosphate transaminase n=1 Tax=Candidatus Bathycorpusculum sp. TaxID=2994959 RepID=UPI00281871A4|nr:histidinol-phosphate transaminase [Candidatus Termitimicrobium sp.]MCL2431213.1 histidinol-phosphate transaminase [Candidatus Termitimicrobium sp.]MDR0492339.1 histidinol-phosphate transaminase [Nitrososphaerota archaeon]
MNTSYQAWFDEKLAKLQNIDCYNAGITPEGLAKQLGVEQSEIIKLNFNENLFIDRTKQTALIKQLSEEIDLRLYPEDEEVKLRKKLSHYLNVPQDFLVVGNAGDELIDRIVRLFIEPRDVAVSFTPSFAIPRLCVKRQGGQYIEIPLRANFQLDTNTMLNTFSDKTRLLYLCSPNNPTTNQLNPQDIEKLVQAFPGIVILDEAYGEFADYSFISRIQEFPNMIILRTFSKAFGLAMLRIGYVVANPELAAVLRDKVPLPYPVSGFSIRMGIKMLENIAIAQNAVSALIAERANLIAQLNQIDGVEAFPSQTDFVLINTKAPADQVYTKLLRRGIILKKWGKLLQYENCFRITVGLPEMNAKLLEALKQIQGDKKYDEDTRGLS